MIKGHLSIYFSCIFICSLRTHNLRIRRLEVVGARKNGRARGRHAETPVLSCAHYFQAPDTQAKNIIEVAFLGEHAALPRP